MYLQAYAGSGMHPSFPLVLICIRLMRMCRYCQIHERLLLHLWGMNLISAGRGAVGVSASVALIQFLKCVKLLLQYKPLQVHLVLTLVCVCAGWRWALLRTKERFMEGSLLWYKMEMIEWKWLPFSCALHTMSPSVVTFNYVTCCLSVLLYWLHWVIIDKNIVGAVPFCIVTHARDSVLSSWLGCSIWLIKLGYPCLTINLDF